MNIDRLVTLLDLFNSPDNAVRVPAEEEFKSFKENNRDLAVQALTAICADQSKVENTRLSAVILLRQAALSDKDEPWVKLSPNVQSGLKTQLLSMLTTEKSMKVLNSLVDFVALLAESLLPNNEWPELLPLMFQLTQSRDSTMRYVALELFSNLTTLLGIDVFRAYLGNIKHILQDGLKDATSLDVRNSALSATSAFLAALTEKEYNLFQDLLPSMLDTISACLSANDVDSSKSALMTFTEIVETAPKFFKESLNDFVGAMVTIIQHKGLDSDIRCLAIEVVIGLVEASPVMMKKLPNFVPMLINLLLSLMCEKDIEIDEGWLNFQEDPELNICDIAEDALDRTAVALKGKSIVPVLLGSLPVLFSSGDWRQRYAAVMSLGLVAEGCLKALKPHIKDCLKNLFMFASDPDPRVRRALCNCVGTFCTDFSPQIQRTYGEAIVSCLLKMMQDPIPRVHSHAAASFINFSECEPEVLIPFLDRIIDALVQLLSKTTLVRVQEKILTTVSSLAEVSGSYFSKYYDTFVPFLKKIISSEVSAECNMLKSRAMECITLIGSVVEAEKFLPDVGEVLNALLNAQSKDNIDDSQSYYLEASFSRLAESLGKDFLPFLEKVLPATLHRAAMDPEYRVFKQASELDDQEGWEVINLGESQLGIHTSQIDDKLSACVVLQVYAQTLGEDFAPYVEQVAQIAVKNLGFNYHNDVRTTSASLLPLLLEDIQKAIETNKIPNDQNSRNSLVNLYNFIYDGFIQVFPTEPEIDVLSVMINQLSLCIELMKDFPLSQDKVFNFLSFLTKQFDEWVKRAQKREEQKREVAEDEEEYEKKLEEEQFDDSLSQACAEAFGMIAKYCPDGYSLIMKNVLPSMLVFLEPAAYYLVKMKPLCIIDDLVEHCGAQAHELIPQFTNLYISLLSDPQECIRQVVAFGLGIFSQASPSLFAPFAETACQNLSKMISMPNSRNIEFEECCGATENAIASLCRILQHNGNMINAKEYLGFFLKSLPLVVDTIEALPCHTFFVELVENRNSDLLELGPSFTINILAQIVTTVFSSSELDKRIKLIFIQLQKQLGDQINGILHALPEESQKNLKKMQETVQ